MFGIFRKVEPYKYGITMAEESIQYVSPVYTGLMKYIENCNLRGLDIDRVKTDPYYLHHAHIYSALAVFEFGANQMEASGINRMELRRGCYDYLQEIGSRLAKKNGDEYSLELEFMSSKFEDAINNCNHYLTTGLTYNDADVDNCMLGRLLMEIAVTTIGDSSIERDFTSERFKGEMLECFDGLDRSIRWLMKSTNPSKVKR